MKALLQVNDLSPYFQRSPYTIRRWMQTGRLPTIRLSRHQLRYVALADLDTFTGQRHTYGGPNLLSQRRAAERLGVSADTVHRAVRLGFVPVTDNGAVFGAWMRLHIEGLPTDGARPPQSESCVHTPVTRALQSPTSTPRRMDNS